MINAFDITDFGAIGDRKTDNTKAIQAALDAASSVRGTVIIPPGEFLTGPLHLHGQGVSMQGTAAWNYRSDGASILYLNDPETDCLLDISGAFGATIRDLCLNGQDLGENIHGIKSWWPEYNGGAEEDTPTIDNCRIGCFTGNGLHLEHIWCFSVRHSMIHRNGGAGLYIDGWDGFILDNWFTANKGGGILSGPVLASITCTGNRVEWNGRGGFVLPFGDSYNITGNFFDRSFGPALELGNEEAGSASLVTVTGNIFRRSGARRAETDVFEKPEWNCHVYMRHCTDTVVMGNTMRVGKNDGGTGVLSPDYSFIIEDCDNCIIKDNTMERGALVENMVLRGDLSTCIIDENIGKIADPDTGTASSLLN